MLGDRRANEVWYQLDEVALYHASPELVAAYKAVGPQVGGDIEGGVRGLRQEMSKSPDYPGNYRNFMTPVEEPLRAMMLLNIDRPRWTALAPLMAYAWALQSVAKPTTQTPSPPLPRETVVRPVGPDAPRVLFISGSAEDDAVVAALRAGARGYMLCVRDDGPGRLDTGTAREQQVHEDDIGYHMAVPQGHDRLLPRARLSVCGAARGARDILPARCRAGSMSRAPATPPSAPRRGRVARAHSRPGGVSWLPGRP